MGMYRFKGLCVEFLTGDLMIRRYRLLTHCLLKSGNLPKKAGAFRVPSSSFGIKSPILIFHDILVMIDDGRAIARHSEHRRGYHRRKLRKLEM